MIADFILNLLSNLYTFLLSLIPRFTFIETLVNAKNEFIDFISSFIAYTLYLFNVPVLKLSVILLVGYIVFLAGEYIVKLGLKYITNLL